MTSLRDIWAAGGETLGFWLSIPSFVSAEMAARQPVDYVCIDTQHGVIDYQACASMIQAIELAGGTPIVRVPWNEPGIIGKTLDAGAHGVIVPMVNTRAEAEAVVRSARYVPDGARSWGPVMAGMRHADNRAWAARAHRRDPDDRDGRGDRQPRRHPVGAGHRRDLRRTGRSVDQPRPRAVRERRRTRLRRARSATIVAGCDRHGVVPGIHATGPLTPRRREQGFRMITVTSDALAMRAGYASELAAARGDGAATRRASGSLY